VTGIYFAGNTGYATRWELVWGFTRMVLLL